MSSELVNRSLSLLQLEQAKTSDPQSEVERLKQIIELLKGEIRGQQMRYDKLSETYTKLADIWNAFQATARPQPRDVHRAEAVGEFARKLCEAVGVEQEHLEGAVRGLIAGAYKPEEFK